MSGGKRKPPMSSALRPPPRAPTPSVATAAKPMGKPRSRHIMPNSTAESPMSEPTLRSMPPVTITGVNARAKRPISTIRRTISKALSRDRKLVPIRLNTAISAANNTANTASCVRRFPPADI